MGSTWEVLEAAGRIALLTVSTSCARDSVDPMPRQPTEVAPPTQVLPPSHGVTAAPTNVQTPTRSALAVFQVEDAIVAGDRIISLHRDGSVVARTFDAAELWRTGLGEAPPGSQLLQRLPAANRVLLRRQNGLTALELADGHVVATHPVQLDDRLFLWSRDGACGLRGECSMQLIDCADGRPLGPSLQGNFRSMLDPDGEYSSGCWGFDADLIGRAGEVVVYLSRDSRGEGGYGVRASDGAPVWQNPSFACSYCPAERIGMDPSGHHCFFATDDDLTLFNCRNGQVRKKVPIPGVVHALWAGDQTGGVFVSNATVARLLDPVRGSKRWQVNLPKGALVVPENARLTDLADIGLRVDKQTPYLLLAVATGQIATRGTLAADASLSTNSQGRVIVQASSATRDHTGQVITKTPPPITVERSHQPAGESGAPNHAVLTDQLGATIDVLDHDAWLIGWRPNYAALLVDSEPRTVAIYHLP